MPRYLTPSKICLLALAELYLSGQTASSARLNVLSFIAANTLAGGVHDGNTSIVESLNAGALEILKPLQQWSTDIPGRNVYDVLLQRLWRLDGLDSLHVLFDQLSERTASPVDPKEPRVGTSRASPLGQYIRRCCVEFTRLQFADSQALWAAFVSYRAPTYETWAHRNPVDARARLSDNEAQLGDQACGTSDSYMNTEDTESLLTFSIHQLQKLGSRLPDKVKEKLQQWIGNQLDSGAQSLQHFLAFFEHWKAAQYTMALESLHRYFDYSLVARNSGSDNMKVYYQYALLHLSVLHADFDCWEGSVEAMDECIATARENQDTACLNFALSWLLYLRQAKPADRGSPFGTVSGLVGAGGGEQDEIAFLKAKAKETKHWSLLSSTLLEEAKLEMYKSGSTAKAQEHIVQSAFLNVQHDLRTLMPAASLFDGASLDRLGQAHLSARMYKDVGVTYGDQCPMSDRVRAVSRVAYAVAQSGQYAASLRSLEALASDVQGVIKSEQRVAGFTTLVQLTRSLHQDDLHAATYYYSQLQALRSFGDPELDFEISVLEIELFLKRHEFERALKTVNAHIRRLKGTANADIAQRLHFLVSKAKIFARSGRPTKGFSISFRAASTAARHLLVPALLEALAAVAVILNDLFEFGAARELLQSALPLIFETNDAELLAQALATLAESHVGFAGHACEPGSGEQTKNMRIAEVYVERSREVYATLEDLPGMLQAFTMSALIARWRGDETSAAHADALYMQALADKQTAGASTI